MNTTSTWQQNRNHRTDSVWQKTGKSVKHNGVSYSAEYTNGFTGQTIRKGLAMTGHDWYIFNAQGVMVRRSTSLTIAKRHAAEVAA